MTAINNSCENSSFPKITELKCWFIPIFFGLLVLWIAYVFGSFIHWLHQLDVKLKFSESFRGVIGAYSFDFEYFWHKTALLQIVLKQSVTHIKLSLIEFQWKGCAVQNYPRLMCVGWDSWTFKVCLFVKFIHKRTCLLLQRNIL